MARLSTHVLDTYHGRPAAGVAIELYALGPGEPRLVTAARTNADGRTDRPLLEGQAVRRGRWRLVFHMGEHWRAVGLALPEPPFVDAVTIDFGIGEDGGNWHVPLVCTPWSYSTYRGS